VTGAPEATGAAATTVGVAVGVMIAETEVEVAVEAGLGAGVMMAAIGGVAEALARRAIGDAIEVARGVGVGAESETELAATIEQIICRTSLGELELLLVNRQKPNVNVAVIEAIDFHSRKAIIEATYFHSSRAVIEAMYFHQRRYKKGRAASGRVLIRSHDPEASVQAKKLPNRL
jgi:hypothetical protein